MSQMADDVVAVLTAVDSVMCGRSDASLDEAMAPLMEEIMDDNDRMAAFMALSCVFAVFHVRTLPGATTWAQAAEQVRTLIDRMEPLL